MRLINAHTLNLVEVNDETEKPYAILSHRWEAEEVSFKAYRKLIKAAQAKGLDTLIDCEEVVKEASKLKGFRKIRSCCQEAVDNEFHCVWIDTCCINKDSSAELSEAINSMWTWYSEAEVCCVYLCDVETDSPKYFATIKSIKESQWFTRGWTLQELLAPRKLDFFDARWQMIGDKLSLSGTLSERTGIDERVLLREITMNQCSIAQRMSWAAERLTTRKEDMAYCLLGIFDVNMPLLYGEGAVSYLFALFCSNVRSNDSNLVHMALILFTHFTCKPFS